MITNWCEETSGSFILRITANNYRIISKRTAKLLQFFLLLALARAKVIHRYTVLNFHDCVLIYCTFINVYRQ